MIVIIDYGMGNLKSVYNALNKLGLPSIVSSDKNDIENAEKIILPGVGSFKDAIDNLQDLGLIDVIKNKVKLGTPLLGICLGMQMLFEKGFECEERNGLGFIKGEVRLMVPKEKVKIPHIGWNKLEINKEDILINNLSNDSFVYYVHSYMATNMDYENLICYSNYGDMKIPGIVRNGNVYGTQFHPEKSGEVGLEILRNFGGRFK